MMTSELKRWAGYQLGVDRLVRGAIGGFRPVKVVREMRVEVRKSGSHIDGPVTFKADTHLIAGEICHDTKTCLLYQAPDFAFNDPVLVSEARVPLCDLRFLRFTDVCPQARQSPRRPFEEVARDDSGRGGLYERLSSEERKPLFGGGARSFRAVDGYV